MLMLHQSGLTLHIAAGAVALLLFWVPLIARKGSLNHRRFGRWFSACMYTVAFSGLVISTLDLLFPLAMHAPGQDLSTATAAAFSREVRLFAHFLLTLSLLVLVATRQGWLAILHRDDRAPLRRPGHVLLCASLVIAGVTLCISGLFNQQVLFVVFGGLEMVAGANSLRYVYKDSLYRNEWWIEHLNGLIGSGIGAYTAFTVFGGRRLFESLFADAFTSYSVVLWIAPGIVGGIAMGLLSRHYRKRFAPKQGTQRETVDSLAAAAES